MVQFLPRLRANAGAAGFSANVAATVARPLVIAICLSLAFPVLAAPVAETIEECVVLANMALVARGLAQEGIKGDHAERILRHIYLVAPGRGEELLKLIISRSEKETTEALEFANRLAATCLYNSGNLDSVLGVSL